MDNFDENNGAYSGGNDGAVPPNIPEQPHQAQQAQQPQQPFYGQQSQQLQQVQQPQYGQYVQYGQYGSYPPPPGYGMPQYAPPPVMPKPEKKRMSKGFIVGIIIVIAAMFAAVIMLSVKIASSAGRNDKSDIFKDIPYTQDAERVEHKTVSLPVAEKPVIGDEYYEDKETGLLTSVGVAKVILPSQVQIKVFDEVPYIPVSSGSGIILTSDGYILTNAHVVDGAVRLSVQFYDDTESEAFVVGIDKKSDLAVIAVDRNDLIPAQIGTSSTLVIGEEVALAGAGGGFENTVTYGHVTGLGREIDTDYISSSTILCIQSDAALNPGNSGGALVNMYGQVVGVAVALMNHETYENIGFSIAIDDAVPIAEDLIAQGYVSSRTRVGITYVSIGDTEASVYGVPAGLCVMDIDRTSGAAKAGLKPYDVITEINGVRVFGAQEISEALADKVPGDTVKMSVFRKDVTGHIEAFEAELELMQDTSSISGYYVNRDEEDYSQRDVIK